MVGIQVNPIYFIKLGQGRDGFRPRFGKVEIVGQ